MRPTDALPHPPDWSVTTIRKAVEIRRGLSWSKEQEREQQRDDTVPVLRITNIQERLDLSDTLHLSGVPAEARALKKVGRGWSILVGSNGNRNRIGNAVFQTEDTDFLFASFLIAAKPLDESGILPEFFYRWLCTYEVQARISASSEGSTGLSNLSHDFFKAMEIAYPEKSEQHAIVRILDAADAAIERTREAIAKARRLKDGLVQQLLSNGIDTNGQIRDRKTNISGFQSTKAGWLPAAWRISSVGREFEIGTGFTLNESRRPRVNKVKYLRVANVQRGHVLLDDIAELEATPDEVADRQLRGGDLLVVEGHADPNAIGRCARVPKAAEGMSFQNHLFRLRGKEISSDFACLWLNSLWARRYWRRMCATSSGLNTINQRMLRALLIPKPELAEQVRISQLAASAQEQIDKREESLNCLLGLKRGLMQDLLTGRVRVNGQASRNGPVRRKRP